MRQLAYLLIPLACVFATTAVAQTMSPSDQAAVQQALNRGQQLYAFDQAAWRATDALQAEAKVQQRLDVLTSQLGGWIVRNSDDQTLEVIFFDRTSDAPKAIYSARLADGGTRVLSSGFLNANGSITDALTLRMIRARQTAAEAVGLQSLVRCSNAPYNLAVLPPETPDGPIPVYILTPQTDLEHVPFGGHSRMLISLDGKAGAAHPFTKSCLDLPTGRAKNAPKAIVATQLLDPVPTEIAVFTMFAAGLPLYIGTPDRRIWAVEASEGQARIRLVQASANER